MRSSAGAEASRPRQARGRAQARQTRAGRRLSTRAVAAGRYRLESELGHGGMAVVYLARDGELDRLVAVKLLAESLASDDSFHERFVREARLAARLSHPNVVHVYDAGHEQGRPYIVTEYVPGETLAERITRAGKLGVAEASELARQAALGLQHAHEAGLVHRDVKPQNLLLRADKVVKVADFGIAHAAEISRLTQPGTVLGSVAYLAPEQATGGDVTAATDVYSLGAVLYELLTGRPPYEFSSLAELAEKQTAGAILPVRDLEPAVPDRLEALVMRCLARDPRFRPVSAAQVADALAAEPASLARSRGPDAATVTLPRRVLQRLPGAGAWIWIAAAAALGAVALVLGLAGIGGSGGASLSQPRPAAPSAQQIAPGATPAADARNLARWLLAHSR